MSSQPALAEISIPAERIIRELEKSAQPGFYGQVEVQLALTDDALKGVSLVVLRRQNVRSQNKPAQINASEKDTEREQAVKKVVGDISRQLRLCLSTVKIVGHISDGMLNNCEVVGMEQAQ